MRPHWIKEGSPALTAIVTHCGIVGTRSWRDSPSLFNKKGGGEILAVASLNGVECENCLKSAKRISETCQTPRGKRRRVPA